MLMAEMRDASSTTEFIPPHRLLTSLSLSLERLASHEDTTPGQIVEALADIVSIITALGPPSIIMRNTDLGPIE